MFSTGWPGHVLRHAASRSVRDIPCTRFGPVHLAASAQSRPLGILQQTRPEEQSESPLHALTGQHLEPAFITRSKSSCELQGKHEGTLVALRPAESDGRLDGGGVAVESVVLAACAGS